MKQGIATGEGAVEVIDRTGLKEPVLGTSLIQHRLFTAVRLLNWDRARRWGLPVDDSL